MRKKGCQNVSGTPIIQQLSTLEHGHSCPEQKPVLLLRMWTGAVPQLWVKCKEKPNIYHLKPSQWNIDFLVIYWFVFIIRQYLGSAKLTFGNLVKPASSTADVRSNSQAWWTQRGHTGSSLEGTEEEERKTHHASYSKLQIISFADCV